MSNREIAKHIKAQYDSAIRRCGGSEIRSFAIAFALDEFGADDKAAAKFFDKCGIFAMDDYYAALRMIQPRAQEAK